MAAGRGLAARWWSGALATLLVSLGVFIALSHPLFPVVLSLVFVAWCGVVFDTRGHAKVIDLDLSR